MLHPSGRWHEGPRSGLHLRRADRQVRGLPRAAERAGGGQDAPGSVGRGRGRAQGGSLQGTATTTASTTTATVACRHMYTVTEEEFTGIYMDTVYVV